MADVTDDANFSHEYTNGVQVLVIEVEADGGDTIDVSDYFQDGCHAIASSDSSTDAAVADTGNYGTTVTLPGSATGETHHVTCYGN